MYRSPVNKLQNRLNSQFLNNLGHKNHDFVERYGLIQKVFDSDTIESEESLPAQVKTMIEAKPGSLVAEVLIKNTLYYLYFEQDESTIYSMYGNSANLKLTPCLIRYRAGSLSYGKIIPTTWNEKMLSLEKHVGVGDISGAI